MKNDKHTAGPLVANGNAIEEDKREGARQLGAAYYDTPDMEPGEVGANARLWAASPDLLRACDAALTLFDGLDVRHTGRSHPLREQIRAAVLAARGASDARGELPEREGHRRQCRIARDDQAAELGATTNNPQETTR